MYTCAVPCLTFIAASKSHTINHSPPSPQSLLWEVYFEPVSEWVTASLIKYNSSLAPIWKLFKLSLSYNCHKIEWKERNPTKRQQRCWGISATGIHPVLALHLKLVNTAGGISVALIRTQPFTGCFSTLRQSFRYKQIRLRLFYGTVL